MPRITIAYLDRGVNPPARVELGGATPYRFDDHFSVDWVDENGSIVFHFAVRPGEQRVVLNSRIAGEWNHEVEVTSAYPFSRRTGIPFLLRFDVLEEGFRTFVDGRHVCDFPHRAPPATIRQIRSTMFLWRLERKRGFALLRRGRGISGKARPPEVRVPSHCARVDSGWIAAEMNPVAPRCLESFRLFAILGTWMEQDVVAATVANTLRQGCERVYVVDNGSTDATAERAVAAGATLIRQFATIHYDEEARIHHMQEIVDQVSEAAGEDHVWWLWLDADEFPHGPAGLTLREYLATLDRRFRIVGARFFNHLPSDELAYQEGRHPLDFQPLCYEYPVPKCELGHWKHALQRWDRGGPRIVSGLGFHTASSAAPLIEPTVPVFAHHFPYRSEAAARLRLAKLFGAEDALTRVLEDDPAHAQMRTRMAAIDAVYAQRWNEAVFPACVPGFTPELQPWDEIDPADCSVARWY